MDLDINMEENIKVHNKINNSLKSLKNINDTQTNVSIFSVDPLIIIMSRDTGHIYIMCSDTTIVEINCTEKNFKSKYGVVKTVIPSKEKYDHCTDYNFECDNKAMNIKKFNRNNTRSFYKRMTGRFSDKKCVISIRITANDFVEDFAVYINNENKAVGIYTP